MIKQIRQNLKTHLESIGPPVFDSRITPNQLKTLPFIVVLNDKFSLENTVPNCLALSGPRNISINVDVAVAHNNDYANLLDDLVESVIDKIGDPMFMAANVDNINNISVSYTYSNDFETILAIATININADILK